MSGGAGEAVKEGFGSHLVKLGPGSRSLQLPLADLATSIPHCRQLCGYDTAVCVCVFRTKTMGRLTHRVLSHTAGGWRVLTPLVCAYVTPIR